MKFTDSSLINLRNRIREYVGDHRYKHILGVEKAAAYLGEIFLPEKVSEIRAAALLHDVSKEIPVNEQLKILKENGIELTDEDLRTAPALHSFSAVPVIKDRFPEFATEEILNAVRKHTLGSSDMTIFDKIIFIADFTEEGRTYDGCVKTAEYIRDNITKNTTIKQNAYYLDKAIIMAIDFTVESILQKNQTVHSSTIATRNALMKNVL